MSVPALRLRAWSQRHAVCISGACVATAFCGQSWPVAVAALFSFSSLFRSGRGQFTPGGSFGAANWVTTSRLALTLALGFWLQGAASWLIASVALLVFALDGLDGWLARRVGCASDFGAHLDMETDALFVLMLGLELWLRGELGAWVLTTGLLRYGYVLAVAHWPRAAEMPRWRFARYAFAVLVFGLVAAFMLPNRVGAAAALLGTLAVSASFARAAMWSLRHAASAQAVSESASPG